MFKICPCCQYQWESLESFVSDRELKLHGYQANFGAPLDGFFLFTHTVADCKSTLSVSVHKFAPIIHHELPVTHFIPGLGPCPKFCLDEKNLSPCPNRNCPGSQVRDLLNLVKTKLKVA